MRKHTRPITAFLKTALVSATYLWMPRGPHISVSPLPPNWRSHVIFFQPKESTTPQPYSVDRYEMVTGLHYTPFLLAENAKTLRLVSKRCRQLADRKQLAREVVWYGAYYRQDLENIVVPPVYIGWTGVIKEWGLFAMKPIGASTLIGEYSGLLLLFRYFFNKVNPYYFHYPLPLSDWLWFTIDAAPYGNETRYINHSDQPNCSSHVVYCGGLLRILIISERAIDAGEELTFDYGKTLWGQGRIFAC